MTKSEHGWESCVHIVRDADIGKSEAIDILSGCYYSYASSRPVWLFFLLGLILGILLYHAIKEGDKYE